MRCLTLAQGFKVQFPQARVIFISNKLPQNLNVRLAQSAIELLTLPFNIDSNSWHQLDDAKATISALSKTSIGLIDLLIVDHYLIDLQWQLILKKHYKKLLVIDDLANRRHLADFLLDQTIDRPANDYLQRVPPYCQLLLGQQYMLLRDEFKQLITNAKQKRNQLNTTKSICIIKNILVNFGGIDSYNITERVLEALIEYHKTSSKIKLSVDVVMSSHSPHLEQIKALIENHSWLTLTLDCNDMAHKMCNADLAIGACGTTAWERCSLGLPTLAIILADNQKLVNENLANQKSIINLGHYKNLTAATIINAIKRLESQPNVYFSLVRNSFKSCDGLGVKRALTRLTSSAVTLAKASKADLILTFKWQSNAEIRRYSRNVNPIEFEDHQQWFLSSLAMKSRHIFMICFDEKRLGILRLDEQSNDKNKKRYEISILIAPEAQGQKLALKAIHAIPKEFDTSEIFAHVHPDNQASHQLFTQANFLKLGEDSYLRPAYLGLPTNEKK
jgi:UDP-2,4-diacetamido-2,4,6-trideoxy-beta-L-altropyranose hydrolase